MRFAIAVLILAVGCGGEARRQKEAAQKNAMNAWAGTAERKNDADKAKVEAINKDRAGLVAEAVKRMRKSAAENFGAAEAEAAKITADESSIKEDFRGEKWEVMGRYEGKDD